LQNFSQSEGFQDIPFNFLIGGDGNVYEGRGDRYQGQISQRTSESSFEELEELGLIVAFIGSFVDEGPSARQQQTFRAFLDSSVRREVLQEDFQILSQDQLVMTNPPPEKLINFLDNEFPGVFYSST
jgi:hypothetical protein